MTILADKNIRDLIGINSWERAIVWSACSLLSAKAQTTIDRDLSIFADPLTQKISINFFLPLDMALFWASMGGDSDLSLKNISELLPTYEGEFFPVNNPLEEEPLGVDSLEKYFVWATKNLSKYYVNSLPERKNNINVSTNIKRSVLAVDISLDYNINVYLNSNSLLKAVIVHSTNGNNSSLIGNNTLIGNGFLVGN